MKDLAITPYDPIRYIELARVDSRLGFGDIGAGNANRALKLIEAALAPHRVSHKQEVLSTMAKRLVTTSEVILFDELRHLKLQALYVLFDSLTLCEDFLSMKAMAKKAFKRGILAGDPRLKEYYISAKIFLKDPSFHEGRIWCKQYPWQKEELFRRSHALLLDINQPLIKRGFEIRPVIFGEQDQQEPGEEFGPLGIFATRDHKTGEIILVDETITGISNIPTSGMRNCDACLATLLEPYIATQDIIRPKCCGRVAFCSRKCYKTASNGYHSIVCGKDFNWIDCKGVDADWLPVMFQRCLAIILADQKNADVHPLQHPLMARMVANYARPGAPCSWKFSENVEAPTRMLLDLGINIFEDPDGFWSPESIQTMYWRMDNNANMTFFDAHSTTKDAARKLRQRIDVSMDEVPSTVMKQVVLNPTYLFLNHSCIPNLSWHGTNPDPFVSLQWLEGYDGEILRPGASAVIARAARNIQKGEQLTISYLGNPNGETSPDAATRKTTKSWLGKWFDGGHCGCEMCAQEMEAKKDEAAEQADNLMNEAFDDLVIGNTSAVGDEVKDGGL